MMKDTKQLKNDQDTLSRESCFIQTYLPAEDETELVMVSYYLFRGVASIFSGVRTIHQMRLNPSAHPTVMFPKVRLSVSLSVFTVFEMTQVTCKILCRHF